MRPVFSGLRQTVARPLLCYLDAKRVLLLALRMPALRFWGIPFSKNRDLQTNNGLKPSTEYNLGVPKGNKILLGVIALRGFKGDGLRPIGFILMDRSKLGAIGRDAI